MLSLSEFLGDDEGVWIKIDFLDNIYKIENNKLFFKHNNSKWKKSEYKLNYLLNAKITILPQPILTDEEREYLKVVVKLYKDILIVIIKNEKSIVIEKDRKVFYENYLLAMFDFTKEMSFKNMEKDKEYRLADLGLDE